MKAEDLVIGKHYNFNLFRNRAPAQLVYVGVISDHEVFPGQHNFDGVDNRTSGGIFNNTQVEKSITEIELPKSIHDAAPMISQAFIHLYDGLNDDDKESLAELEMIENYIVELLNA